MKDKVREKSRKNGKKKDADLKSAVGVISSEALRGVIAIFLFAISGFLILALAGVGGAAGAALYNGLTWLLGIGYLLLPLSMIMLAILIFRSLERSVSWVHVISMAIFLLSGLGLIALAYPMAGGVLGDAIAKPIVAAVDVFATVIFLLAFTVMALIVAFDIHLGEVVRWFKNLVSPSEDDGMLTPVEIDDVPVTGMAVEADEPDAPTPIAEAEPKREKEPSINKYSDKVNEEGGFPIIAATGSTYTPPPASLLAKNKGKPEVGDVKANMNIIKRTLQNFGIQVEMDEANIGPTVTRYSMKPAEGVRLAKIVALQSNLELALAASPVRIEAPIPGKSLVGIEVPNISRTTLGMGPLVSDDGFTGSEKALLIALGRTITGAPQYADLARMPHMLVAGTTGAGKSVTIHDIVVSLLYRCGPERLRFIMVDPKRVELTLYNPIPHLLTPVITDAKKAILALKWLAKEMERRYNILEAERVRDIGSYHDTILKPALEKGPRDGEPMPEAMPYIVLIIDELADIMTAYPRELEGGIVRLAQMSRAVGIHLILSTQRPSVKVITGLIKANIPARIALQVSSQIDSRTILDMGGAESLLGAGDMLFLSGEMSKPNRVQAPYITEMEVKNIVAYIAKHNEPTLATSIDMADKVAGGTDAIFSSMIGGDDEDSDELYPEAKRTVIEAGKASTSYLQRKLGVGYARAAKLMDILEERGVIGPADGAKPREIIGAGNADELAAEPVEAPSEFSDDPREN
ncbi:MAG: DNA translocase FtsK 4TM domain-containing protein [Candidatus Pacebacteria bacterium]|nr:DNA translocase FtsK 4TM domain-containing protein [Candidatus Paceibacterota bacterium]